MVDDVLGMLTAIANSKQDMISRFISSINSKDKLPDRLDVLKGELDNCNDKLYNLINENINMTVNNPNLTNVDGLVYDNIYCVDEDFTNIDNVIYIVNSELTDVDDMVERDMAYIKSKQKELNNDTKFKLLLVSSMFLLAYKIYQNVKINGEMRYPSEDMYNVSIKPNYIRLSTLNKLLETYYGDVSMYVLSVTLRTLIMTLINYIVVSNTYKRNKRYVSDNITDRIHNYINNNTCEGVEDINKLMLDRNISNNVNRHIDVSDYDNIECSTVEDMLVTPSKPFLNKIYDLDCETTDVYDNKPISIQHVEDDKLTNAIIANVKYLGDIGDTINYAQNIDGFLSPISGKVTNITTDAISITNVIDGEMDVSKYSSKLCDMYKSQTDIEDIIMQIYYISIYPILIYNAKGDSHSILEKNINTSYDKLSQECKHLITTYENSVQNICNVGNVKQHSENGDTDIIYDNINTAKKQIIQDIKHTVNTYITSSNKYIRDVDQMKLAKFYVDILLYNCINLDNKYSDMLMELVYTFLPYRITEGEYNISNLEKNLSEEILVKSNNKLNIEDLYNIFKDVFSIEDIVTYLNMYINDKLFNRRFASDFIVLTTHHKYTNTDKSFDKNELVNECNMLLKFWDKIFIEYGNILETISDIYKELGEIGKIDNTYSTISENGINLRYYNKHKNESCVYDDTIYSDILSPQSKYDITDISYWKRYLNIATLVGCNPIFWSTGLVVLGAPILLPIIYIPLSCIKTKWGLIVIGLSICGVSISPLFIYLNLNNNVASIIPNVIVNTLEMTIDSLIDMVRERKRHLRSDIITPKLSELYDTTLMLDDAIRAKNDEKTLIKHNIMKPPKIILEDRVFQIPNLDMVDSINITYNGVSYDSNIDEIIKICNDKTTEVLLYMENNNVSDVYISEFNSYVNNVRRDINAYNKLSIDILTLKTTKYGIDSQISKLNKYNNGVSNNIDDLAINNMESEIDRIEKLISDNKQRIMDILISVPISLMYPNSMYFGITPKRFNILNKIESNINETINMSIIDNIINSYTINPNDITSDKIPTDYSEMLSIVNALINGALDLIILKDNLPKYERLNIGNIKFVLFLNTNFCLTSSKCFGIPGYP